MVDTRQNRGNGAPSDYHGGHFGVYELLEDREACWLTEIE